MSHNYPLVQERREEPPAHAGLFQGRGEHVVKGSVSLAPSESCAETNPSRVTIHSTHAARKIGAN